MTKPRESLLKFPCDFTIKIFGNKTDAFETEALTIVHQHVPNLAENAIQSRTSGNGKYLALSVTIHAVSQAQLDSIYQDLSASPHIIMAL